MSPIAGRKEHVRCEEYKDVRDTIMYTKIWEVKSIKSKTIVPQQAANSLGLAIFALWGVFQPYGWPCLTKEMNQGSEKSWSAIEGSSKWSHLVDTAFPKRYICLTGGRIQYWGEGVVPIGAFEKTWWIICYKPCNHTIVNGFYWMYLLPFQRKDFIVKAIQFRLTWASLAIKKGVFRSWPWQSLLWNSVRIWMWIGWLKLGWGVARARLGK